jgi:hypothetical protein
MSHNEEALSIQLFRLYKLFSAVLGNPKQENLRICQWEPKKRDPTRWCMGIAKNRTFRGTWESLSRTKCWYFLISLQRQRLFSCIFRHSFYTVQLKLYKQLGFMRYSFRQKLCSLNRRSVKIFEGQSVLNWLYIYIKSLDITITSNCSIFDSRIVTTNENITPLNVISNKALLWN